MEAVPRSERVGVVREASEAAQTEAAKKSAENGFWAEVWEKTKTVFVTVGGAVAAEAVAALARRTGAALLRLRCWCRSRHGSAILDDLEHVATLRVDQRREAHSSRMSTSIRAMRESRRV